MFSQTVNFIEVFEQIQVPDDRHILKEGEIFRNRDIGGGWRWSRLPHSKHDARDNQSREGAAKGDTSGQPCGR